MCVLEFTAILLSPSDGDIHVKTAERNVFVVSSVQANFIAEITPCSPTIQLVISQNVKGRIMGVVRQLVRYVRCAKTKVDVRVICIDCADLR